MKNSLSHLVKTKTRQNTLSSLIRLSSATEKKLKQKRDVKSLSLKPKIRLQAKRKLFKLNVSGFQCKSRKSLHLWSLLRQSLFLKRGHLQPLVVYFGPFQTNNTFFTTNYCENINGFSDGIRTLPLTTRPGTGPIKILQRKSYATRFFKHFDWMLIIFNQSKCLKKLRCVKFTL